MWPFTRKPKVLVRVHKAFFSNIMELEKEPYYFINVLNTDKSKNIIIEDVLCYHPLTGTRTIRQTARPLPVKVTPGEQWETWIKVEFIGEDAFKLFCVYFNDSHRNKYAQKSIRRMNVPSSGTVPGGQ